MGFLLVFLATYKLKRASSKMHASSHASLTVASVLLGSFWTLMLPADGDLSTRRVERLIAKQLRHALVDPEHVLFNMSVPVPQTYMA